jgi:hypothetical protein
MSAATAGKSGQAFHEAERAQKTKIESACGTSAQMRCEVVTLYHGGIYSLYRYRRYQDIRLAFAPEGSVAFFGGDPDNFTYPRFDLDVSFLRIYDDGRPLRAENYLKFASTGVKAGDIALTSGNPGASEREDTLAQLLFERDLQQPFLITFLSELRGLLSQYASQGVEAARTSSRLLFSVENSLKAYKGRQQALVDGRILADKARTESALRHRVAANPKLARATGDPWTQIAAAEAHEHDIAARWNLLERSAQSLSPLMARAIALNRYATESIKPDAERLEEYNAANSPALRLLVTSPVPIYPQLERTVIAWWLTKVRENLGTTDRDVESILGKQSPDELAAAIVSGTHLQDAALRGQLLDGGAAAIAAYHDPLMDFVRTLDGPARRVRADRENNVAAVITKNSALIAKARFALEGTKDYPDATFTLRLSYGAVAGYRENGHDVPPITDFAGAYAHATGRDPFRLPDDWIAAEPNVNSRINLNFVSTNDIIGGNSGSPVIGRHGEVIGLIFDGNIQSLAGDFGYDQSVNRAVAVDVTGIVEAMGKIYHAGRLVSELNVTQP